MAHFAFAPLALEVPDFFHLSLCGILCLTWANKRLMAYDPLAAGIESVWEM
jgi:hypothetical protein